MSGQYYMDLERVDGLRNRLNSAGMDTQGGVPHLQRTQEGLQAAIQQLISATGGLRDGLALLRKVQSEHLSTSFDTVHKALTEMDEALRGAPGVSLTENLSTWNKHSHEIWEEVQQVISAGTPIETQLDDWSRPSGALPNLEQTVNKLAASLNTMSQAISGTNDVVSRLQRGTQDVANTRF